MAPLELAEPTPHPQRAPTQEFKADGDALKPRGLMRTRLGLREDWMRRMGEEGDVQREGVQDRALGAAQEESCSRPRPLAGLSGRFGGGAGRWACGAAS